MREEFYDRANYIFIQIHNGVEMIIEQKDIDFLTVLINKDGVTNYPHAYLQEILEQTRIFHYLMAVKIIKNEPIPELVEISEKLDKILTDRQPTTSQDFTDKKKWFITEQLLPDYLAPYSRVRHDLEIDQKYREISSDGLVWLSID